jgi:hypothetical protein
METLLIFYGHICEYNSRVPPLHLKKLISMLPSLRYDLPLSEHVEISSNILHTLTFQESSAFELHQLGYGTCVP